MRTEQVCVRKMGRRKGALSSPLQAMQGQIPGVIITRQSSAPGDENWGMSLRGAVSTNSSEPLVIIDGVAYESINDMRLLNPSDIESMSILKDGAAAIYGSRAAGGVVLITTKKGKEGRAAGDGVRLCLYLDSKGRGEGPDTVRHLQGCGQGDGVCRFSYSLDGKSFKDSGTVFQAREGRWIGARTGLFCSSQDTGKDRGWIDIDWFRIEE